MSIGCWFQKLGRFASAALAVSTLLPGAGLFSGAGATAHAQTLTSPVGVASATQTATVTITTPGAAASVLVVTQGSQALDFAISNPNNGSCGLALYGAGQTCTVQYTFTPTRPFTRTGSAIVYDALGNVLGNAFLTGIGTGSQVSYPPGPSTASTAQGSGFNKPAGVAVDAAGNIFVADTQNNAVKEIPVSGGAILTLGYGFAAPAAVAVDGAGNVYVADAGNAAVKEIVATNGTVPAGTPAVIRTLASNYTFVNPQGIAVDGSGNVFVADKGKPAVLAILAVNGVIPGTSPTVNPVATNFTAPVSVAVDPAGNVYVADQGTNSVVEVQAGTGSQVTLSSGLNAPQGVAVDGLGNVYVGDAGNNAVKEFISGGTTTTVMLGSGFNMPSGVAVDAAGDVFVADTGNSAVSKLAQTAPSLAFNSTAVGTTGADSPRSLVLQNSGNAPLLIAIPASGSNPVLSASYTLAATGSSPQAACPQVVSSATSPGSLAAGATCAYPVNYVPATAGNVPGSLTLTDNNLGANNNSTQTFSLSGTATPGTPGVTVSSPSVSVDATTVTLQASVTYGGVAPTGAFTFSVNSGTAVTANCTGTTSPLTCTANYDPSSLQAGSYTIQGTLAQDANYNSASSNGTLVVNTGTPNVNLSTSGSPSAVDGSVTFTAMVAPKTGIVPTGAVSFNTTLNGAVSAIRGCTNVAVSNGSATCITTALRAGTNSVTATIASDNNFTSATSNTVTQTVAAASTTLTITSSQSTAASVNQAVKFTATLTSAQPFTIQPTGTVRFTTGGAVIPGCDAVSLNTSNQTATCTAYALVAPSDAISAVYTSGDGNFGGSTAANFAQVVNKAAPVNTISSNLQTTAVVDQTVTFTAVITPANNSSNGVTPAGSVTFSISGGAQLCPPVVVAASANGTGTASCSAAFGAVSAGTSVVAVYSGDSNFTAGNSPAVSQTVSAASTSIAASSIATNPSSPAVNQTGVTLNAVLAPAFSGATAPTGTVVFSDTFAGNTVTACTSAINSGVVAPCSYTFTASGLHTLTATYSGDTNFSKSSSSNAVSVVPSGTVTINLTTSSSPITVNQSATYSAAFSPVQTGPAYPAGTVQYFDGSNSITGCNVTVSPNGTIPSCTETLTSAGTHVISAAFTSTNSNFGNITSGNLAEVVNQNSTKTSLTSPTQTSTVDQVVTFSATVTPTVLKPAAIGTTAPGGTVLFSYTLGGVSTTICSATVTTSNGVTAASCQAALTAATTYPITAVYSGDLNFTTSSSAAYSQVVNKTGTTLGLVAGSTLASPATPAVNQSAAYTVQLSLAGSLNTTGLTAPTGNVQFNDASSGVSCSAPLTSSGQASCALAEPTSGAHTIAVSYPGDGNFTSSAANLTVSITSSSTSIVAASISTNPSSPMVDQTGVVLNATLSPAYTGTALPSGTLIFTDAASGVASTTCTTTVTNGVVAPCSHVFTTSGTHTITAAYQGDANFSAVTQTGNVTVGGAGTLGLALTSTGTVLVNQQATYSAAFSPAPNGPTYPTGSVQFFDGSTPIAGCNAAVSATGTITSCTETLSTAGTHIVTAAFTSTNPGNFSSTTSGTLPQVVNQNGTRTALTSPSAPTTVDQPVVFTAIVSPAALNPSGPGTTLPTGTIVFNAAGPSGVSNALCAATVSTTAGSTSASCTAPFTAAGSYAVTAVYGGDSNFLNSTSSSYSEVVNKTGTSVTLVTGAALSNPVSPAANQTATYTVQVTPAVSAAGLTLPTGNVIFTDSTPSPAVGCTAVVVASTGQASCSFSTTGNGVHNVLAVYTGDSNFSTSNQTFPEQIALASPVLTITQPTVNPTINQPGFAFNATLAVPAGSSGQPTGTVTFTDSVSGTSCTSTLSGGVVPPCSYVFGAAGSSPHTITALYSGDKSFSSATGTLSLSVSPATPVLSLVSASPTSVATQQVTFSATVTPSPAAVSPATGTPSGTVSFAFPQGSVAATCPAVTLPAGGPATATCTVTFVTYPVGGTGIYNVTATYSGDRNYLTTQRSIVQNVQSYTPGLTPSSVALGQGDSNNTDPYSTASSIVYTLSSQNAFSGSTTTSCPSTVSGLTCAVPATFSLGSAVPVVVSTTNAVAPGVYTLQVTTRDSSSSLVQSTPLSVTVIGRVYPSGSTVPYSVATIGQVTIPFTLPATLAGSTYTCNSRVANVGSNGTYSQNGDTLTGLGLTCSVAASGTGYTVTITAGSASASLRHGPLNDGPLSDGPLSSRQTIFAAGIFAPFFLLFGIPRKSRRMRSLMVRAMVLCLLAAATLYSTGCSSGGFSRGGDQTFAVGGSYLIGISNASGTTVTEVPLLVTGNGAGL